MREEPARDDHLVDSSLLALLCMCFSGNVQVMFPCPFDSARNLVNVCGVKVGEVMVVSWEDFVLVLRIP